MSYVIFMDQLEIIRGFQTLMPIVVFHINFYRRGSELMSQLLELEQLREKSNTAEHRVKV